MINKRTTVRMRVHLHLHSNTHTHTHTHTTTQAHLFKFGRNVYTSPRSPRYTHVRWRTRGKIGQIRLHDVFLLFVQFDFRINPILCERKQQQQ